MNKPQPHYANDSIPCNECHAGVMHRRFIAYFTWLGEELVTVPNFPAWVCDMCGKREYDGRAISMLVTLLSPEAGKPTRRVKRAPQPASRKRSVSHPPSASG